MCECTVGVDVGDGTHYRLDIDPLQHCHGLCVVLCWEGKWMSTSAQVIAQIPYSSLEWVPVLGPYKSTSHAGPNTYKPSTELPLWCIVVHRAMCNRSILLSVWDEQKPVL